MSTRVVSNTSIHPSVNQCASIISGPAASFYVFSLLPQIFIPTTTAAVVAASSPAATCGSSSMYSSSSSSPRWSTRIRLLHTSVGTITFHFSIFHPPGWAVCFAIIVTTPGTYYWSIYPSIIAEEEGNNSFQQQFLFLLILDKTNELLPVFVLAYTSVYDNNINNSSALFDPQPTADFECCLLYNANQVQK